MIDPHNPEVKGVGDVQHDGRPDASHEEEVRRADGTSTKSDERHEGGGSDN